ncbi:aminodeoxychorismate/anthranilate synthase component II [Algoriphagus confluentis]|uniref:Aminodeoxychorismate/anthranilate synthase component II n=1 Tax=Algoriphagus confluentis TaxID=1697556 RepID=A0ABQ6PJZ0_9BACT|nr:aminodeoxychorismate/anthranilate synthase component II [Algoriphagus confluentis]
MGLLLLDHQDSFTYNLAELITEVTSFPLQIISSSSWQPAFLEDIRGVILSPGPMRPKDHPGLFPCIEACAEKNIPLLGVCLGHQGIGEYFGASLIQLPQVIHGRKKSIEVQPSDELFAGLPTLLEVGLYHSWMLEKDTLPEVLEIIGISAENEIMAIRHREKPIFGIQFHPESFLTPQGAQVMSNFISLCP